MKELANNLNKYRQELLFCVIADSDKSFLVYKAAVAVVGAFPADILYKISEEELYAIAKHQEYLNNM